MSNLRHWLWLSTRGPAPGMYAARILDHFGTPETAYYADPAEYAHLEGVPQKVRQALEDKDLSQADQILTQCQSLGIHVLTSQDAAFPRRLAQLDSAPCVLYVKGRLPQIDQEAAVAIVGARQASPYGVMAAGRMGLDLARQGVLVVSGSARGVDAAALQGALRGGGQVISVLGNGIDVIYPPYHRDLYEDVAAAGALISEYPPGTPPAASHFPVRNRLIAGLCLGVLVVEGTETSGSLITARWALEQGRDVFAVPGSIDAPLSRGPNGLIRRSEAKLVQDAWDVIEEYRELYPDKLRPRTPLSHPAAQARLERLPAAPARPLAASREETGEAPVSAQEEAPARLVIDLAKDPEALPDDQAALLRALQRGQGHTADELVEATGLPARRVLSALTILQVRQMVAEENRRFTTLVELREDIQPPQ